MCVSGCVIGLEWYPCSTCNTDTTPNQPHRNSNRQWTTNNTTNVVIQQNSCKLLMMDILTSETCWAHKKRNKIASDIKLVFYSSTRGEIYVQPSSLNIKPIFFHTWLNVINEHMEQLNSKSATYNTTCMNIQVKINLIYLNKQMKISSFTKPNSLLWYHHPYQTNYHVTN